MESYCLFNSDLPNDQWCQAPFHVHVSSLVKGLSESFAHSLVGLYFFLRFEGSLCFRHKPLSSHVITFS